MDCKDYLLEGLSPPKNLVNRYLLQQDCLWIIHRANLEVCEVTYVDNLPEYNKQTQ